MCFAEWGESVIAVLAMINLLLLAAFLAACTARVLSGGTGRIIPTPEERLARRLRRQNRDAASCEARVGKISLEDDDQ